MGIAANALGFSGPLLPALPRPDQRQKVERPIGYLQDSCFYARRFANDADLNEQAQRWLEQTANVRRHDTTGDRPLERFERDARGALQPLAERPYRRIARHTTGRHDSAQALARVRSGGTPPATRLCGGCSMRAPSDDAPAGASLLPRVAAQLSGSGTPPCSLPHSARILPHLIS